MVDFSPLGQDSPAHAVDWLNPGGAVTATSLATHPSLGTVSVGDEGQQSNVEYGLNVEPHVDPIQGDERGVRCEPIPYEVRFVDVGTKMTHSAVIEWGDGSGWDLLYGKSGNDVLLGGSGGDRLFGGPGRDLLIGGLLGPALELERGRPSGGRKIRTGLDPLFRFQYRHQ